MKVNELHGTATGAERHIGIAVSDFNGSITQSLLKGAMEVLESAGVEEVTVVHVPGALELGVALHGLSRAGCDGLVAIGAVIEGETDHYRHVATQTAAAISQMGLQGGSPVANAVLTVRSVLHARERSSAGPGNKGAEAARAVLETIDVMQQLEEQAAH